MGKVITKEGFASWRNKDRGQQLCYLALLEGLFRKLVDRILQEVVLKGNGVQEGRRKS